MGTNKIKSSKLFHSCIMQNNLIQGFSMIFVIIWSEIYQKRDYIFNENGLLIIISSFKSLIKTFQKHICVSKTFTIYWEINENQWVQGLDSREIASQICEKSNVITTFWVDFEIIINYITMKNTYFDYPPINFSYISCINLSGAWLLCSIVV